MEPEPTTHARNKTFRGRLGRFVLWIVVLVSAGYTGVFFKLNDQILGGLISQLVTRSVRGSFQLGRAHYDYLGGLISIFTDRPTHVVGSDFEMRDPDGNLVMRVPRVDAEMQLQTLLRSLVRFGLTRHFHVTLHFTHAEVHGGYAVVVPTRSTWGTSKPELNIVATMSGKHLSTDEHSNLTVQVDDLDVGPVDFALGGASSSGERAWLGRLEGMHAHGRLEYSSSKRRATNEGPHLFFELRDISTQDGALQLGDFDFPLTAFTAGYFGTVASAERGVRYPGPAAENGFGPRQTLSFSASGVTYAGNVTARGAIVDAYSNHPGLDLSLELEHGRGLTALLPEPVASWIGGDPRGTLTVQGPFADPHIGGELAGATVDLAGLRVTDAGGRFAVLDGGRLRFDQLRGVVGRGRVRGRLDLRLGGDGSWRAEIDASGVDPGTLPPVPESLRKLVAGRLGGHLALTGAFGASARSSAIDIEVRGATLERNRNDVLPRKLSLDGKIAWLGTHVTLKEVALRGDDAQLALQGDLGLDAGAPASLDFALSLDAGTWLERAGLGNDVQLDRGTLRGSVSGPLLGLEGKARLEVAGLTVRGRHFDNASADLALAAGRLSIDHLTGQGVGAQLSGHGGLTLFAHDNHGRTRLDQQLAEPMIDAKLRAQGANLGEVLATVGVVGHGDLDVGLIGPLSGPSGHATLAVPEVSLLGDRYRDGRLAFNFSHQGAEVTALHLERADGGWFEGEGHLGWHGELDLTLNSHDFPLAAIPGVSQLPVAVLGTVSGRVHLGGALSRPQPGGTISLVGAKIRDTLFGDGSLKLAPGTDAIHITGKFFQSYSVDGYLTLFPKISVAVTVGFKDIEVERLFPELRRFAEVRGKASGEARITADADGGLTFAGLHLTGLSLVLSGLDESGRARRLLVRNSEDVTLSTDGHELVVDNCHLRSAIGAFSIHGRISQKDSDVQLNGQIGLELLEYFFTSFFQRMSGDALVDLHVRGDVSAHPSLLGFVDLRRAFLQPRGLEGHRVFVPSGVVRFRPDGVRLENLKVGLDGAVAQASGSIALDGFVPGAISGDVSGELSARLLQWALPDQIDEATGRVATTVHLRGTWQRPEWRGTAEVRNVRLSLRRTGREVSVDQGTLSLNNYDVTFGCGAAHDSGNCHAIAGMIDDESKYSIEGRLGFGDRLALRSVNVHADASDLGYNGGDFTVRVSPALDLAGDGQHLELAGVVNLVEGRYTSDFNLVNMIFKPTRSVERMQPFWEGIDVLESMKLDLRAKTVGPLTVRNNIADLSFAADLNVGGTLDAPRVGGEVTIEQGGTINVPACRFPFVTERSQLTFDPEKHYPETPYVQLSATGVLVSDRTDSSQNVNIQLLGPIGAAQLQLTAQGGVQGADVLQMCLSGRTADEVHRSLSPSTSGVTSRAPVLGQAPGTTTGSGLAASATGALLASTLDPLRKVVKLDTLGLEFGSTGVDVRLCKRWTRGLKTCGNGEIGFVGGTRVSGNTEYRILDRLSVMGLGEYLTRGVETEQDSLTRGRLELNLKLPLIW